MFHFDVRHVGLLSPVVTASPLPLQITVCAKGQPCTAVGARARAAPWVLCLGQPRAAAHPARSLAYCCGPGLLLHAGMPWASPGLPQGRGEPGGTLLPDRPDMHMGWGDWGGGEPLEQPQPQLH